MPKQKQVAAEKSNKTSRNESKPLVVEELTGDEINLAHLPAGTTTVERNLDSQVAWLHDSRLPAVQRQTLAAEMGRVQGNKHLQRALVSLERGQGRAETRQEPAEFNVALYDYNLDHMHIRGEAAWTEAVRNERHEQQRNAFRGWALNWARQNRAIGLDGVTPGRAVEMNNRQEILDGINNTYRAANQDRVARSVPESQWRKIDTVAFFCHGSPDSGLVRLDVRDVRSFVAAIDRALSPHVRFLLFACSTGQGRWQRGMIRSRETVESESVREAEGGEGSWAARLAEALLRRGVEMGEAWRGAVWGHTTSGTAVGVPNWREFRARFAGLDPVTRRHIYAIQGRSYFDYVFNEAVTLNYFYLHARYSGLSTQARTAWRKEFPANEQDLRNRWMYPFYTAVARGELASRVPDDPDGCKERILDLWRTYYTGSSRTVLSRGTRGANWLLNNNFDDLPSHIPEPEAVRGM